MMCVKIVMSKMKKMNVKDSTVRREQKTGMQPDVVIGEGRKKRKLRKGISWQRMCDNERESGKS